MEGPWRKPCEITIDSPIGEANNPIPVEHNALRLRVPLDVKPLASHISFPLTVTKLDTIMTMFSPDQFLDMQVTEANDTVVIPVPVGEYIAVVKEVKIRPWQSKADPSKAGIALDLQWTVDDANVKALLGRDEVNVKQGVMLDISEAGGFDMGRGKNIGLGRLRDALNLNKPGEPFSVQMLVGRAAKVRVEHRAVDDQIFAEVKAVARM